MNALVALWELSLVLCMVAAAALFGLVVARLALVRSTDRRGTVRAKLLDALLSEGGAINPDTENLTKVEREVAATLTGELAEMTRGSERANVLDRARELGVPQTLARRMRSPFAQTRLNALETLAMFDEELPAVRAALDDRDADVRLGAALALGQRGEAPPPAELVARLGVSPDRQSLLLVSLMADLVEKDAAAVAALLFERDVPAEAKVAAIDALADAGGEYTPLLAYMARESAGEPDLQPRIYRALGRNGHPQAVDAIVHGFASPDAGTRASAAQAAGKAGAGEAAPHLRELLADADWWVRYRAGEALLRLGPRGLAELRAASAGDDADQRGAAVALLAEGRAA